MVIDNLLYIPCVIDNSDIDIVCYRYCVIDIVL